LSFSELFLLIVRWSHLVSATAWLGGSLFYLLVLCPALRRAPDAARTINEAVAAEFRVIVETCMFVLLATGVILTFNRLTPGVAGVPYAATLTVKIVLAIWMFVLARGRRRQTALMRMYKDEPTPMPNSRMHRAIQAVSGYNLVVVLGVIVFLLSDALKVLFESALDSQ
jgi:uncharacterized membrane protein